MPSSVSSHFSDTFKSNNTVMPSSKSFLCIFKAAESPLNMIYSLTERHQRSRAAAQSTHIPSPSKRTGMTATSAFPDFTYQIPQIDLGVCGHAWMSVKEKMRNQYFLCIYESLRPHLAPFCHQNTRSWCSGLFPRLLNEA